MDPSVNVNKGQNQTLFAINSFCKMISLQSGQTHQIIDVIIRSTIIAKTKYFSDLSRVVTRRLRMSSF